jgi:hypothetical protein
MQDAINSKSQAFRNDLTNAESDGIADVGTDSRILLNSSWRETHEVRMRGSPFSRTELRASMAPAHDLTPHVCRHRSKKREFDSSANSSDDAPQNSEKERCCCGDKQSNMDSGVTPAIM